jgi:hypothetical protein
MIYTFARDCGPLEWIALPRNFKRGETIFRYSGHDYGCARDDMVYGGRETISCCEVENTSPFFTVPVEFIRDEFGKQPMGDYIRVTSACRCWRCLEKRKDEKGLRSFIVCKICGNKRCPHANDHRNPCTNSNEPGQKGSAYE